MLVIADVVIADFRYWSNGGFDWRFRLLVIDCCGETNIEVNPAASWLTFDAHRDKTAIAQVNELDV